MTAPTPHADLIANLRVIEENVGETIDDDDGLAARFAINALMESANSLAAVTAEREGVEFLLRKTEDELHQERSQREATKSTLGRAWDELRQARQMLADAEQKIASMELDASLREEDERFADPL